MSTQKLELEFIGTVKRFEKSSSRRVHPWLRKVRSRNRPIEYLCQVLLHLILLILLKPYINSQIIFRIYLNLRLADIKRHLNRHLALIILELHCPGIEPNSPISLTLIVQENHLLQQSLSKHSSLHQSLNHHIDLDRAYCDLCSSSNTLIQTLPIIKKHT